MERAAIVFDGACGFCRWSVELVLRWDRRGRLQPLALQDPAAQALLAGLDPERRAGSWHLVTAAGEVHSAGAAFPPLLRLLPGGRPLAALAERFPHATERGYRLVARNRGPLGRIVRSRSSRGRA